MNTKRAPKVRFKGFTDAWELRKFESIAARASSIVLTLHFLELNTKI